MDTSLTPKQKYAFECVASSRNIREAAAKYGSCERSFRKLIKTAKDHGHEPPKTSGQIKYNTIPGQREGFEVKGLSSLVKNPQEDGTVLLEWVKQYKPEGFDHLERLCKSLEKRVSCKAKKIKTPTYKNTDLSIWLPIGDPHFGMYAWAKETHGEDYDMDIAIECHENAIRKLIDVREKVDLIVIAPLGDLFHADNRNSRTEKNGNPLDSDGRYWRVFDMAVESLIRSIEYAATKAKKVKIICPPGNHDWHVSGHALRDIRRYFGKTKHIEVNCSAAHQIYEIYGNNLIGFCHGDMEKLKDLPSIMSCDQREAWGKTKYHYWYTGHIHQQKVFEHPSCIVESFNTIATKDAWSTEKGFRSRRQMTAIVLHKEHGEIERRVVRPEHFQ